MFDCRVRQRCSKYAGKVTEQAKRWCIFRSSAGFTYLAALMIIVIMGIMLGAIGQSWKTTMQREREEELLFRGNQIRQAIERWNAPRGEGKPPPTKLNDLKDLLKDPGSVGTVRYLRRLYTDPITGKDFDVLMDPVKGIIGVMSSSEEEPLKKGGFPEELVAFEGQNQYKKWVFAWTPQATPGAATVKQ